MAKIFLPCLTAKEFCFMLAAMRYAELHLRDFNVSAPAVEILGKRKVTKEFIDRMWQMVNIDSEEVS